MDTNENRDRELKEGHHSHHSHHSHSSHHSRHSHHGEHRNEYSSSRYKSSKRYASDPTSEMERRGESIIYKEVRKKKVQNMVKRVTFVSIFSIFLLFILIGIANPDFVIRKNPKNNVNTQYDLQKEKWDLEIENRELKEYISELEEYVRDLEDMYTDETDEEITPFEFEDFSKK